MITFDNIRRTIEDVLDQHFSSSRDRQPVNFYTPAEWTARTELVGARALLSMTMEGPVNHVMNCYNDDKAPAKALHSELTAALARIGVYGEFGHSWTFHVYLDV